MFDREHVIFVVETGRLKWPRAVGAAPGYALRVTDSAKRSTEYPITFFHKLAHTTESGPDFLPYAVRDGQLITGQNPASSEAVARLVLAAMRESASLDSAK